MPDNQIKDENLRLIYTEEERARIDALIKNTKFELIIYAVLMAAFPLLSVFLSYNDFYYSDYLANKFGNLMMAYRDEAGELN